jgi:hypothetical protein
MTRFHPTVNSGAVRTETRVPGTSPTALKNQHPKNAKTKLLCFMLSLVGASAAAQGNFLYTWHGSQNLFQASFQVLAYENQPGQYFEAGPFKSTFTVVSSDAVYPPSTFVSGDDASGFGPPLSISVRMENVSSGTGLLVSAGDNFDFIGEYLLSNLSVVTWREQGYWTYAQIPEPATPTLLALAVAALVCRKLHR